MPELVSADADADQLFFIAFRNHGGDEKVWHTEATIGELAQGWLENGERKRREEQAAPKGWLELEDARMAFGKAQFTGKVYVAYREKNGRVSGAAEVDLRELALAWLEKEEQRLLRFTRANNKSAT